MGTLNILAIVCVLYVAFLFAVAFVADRAALAGRAGWLRSPFVYTLSLSIYCTAWTFYGAVGFAARSGLEYLTVYLGPTLVMIGWWVFLRKMVRVARSQRITSIADLLSSRFGKSNAVAVAVTLIAVVGTTPYIALQLQSVSLSLAAFSGAGGTGAAGDPGLFSTALWISAGLVVFAILFGTRHLDASERHPGVVMAIALEAVVKLLALLAVGAFVVWGVAGGIGGTLARIDESDIARWEVTGGRWAGLTLLSAMAFLCLPRMFQVMVVENQDESHLRTASWAFPGYLILISLFVVPIAAVGLWRMPSGSNPDLFVLTLPLTEGAEWLAILSFLGGFSSATSMVVVAAIALSTMVSNHVVMPLWLGLRGGDAAVTLSGDVRNAALLARRVSIGIIVFLGYAYYRLSGGGEALAAIGLISFAGVAQFFPALMGGLFWRGANRSGALAGLAAGFAIWLYCLYLPSFGPTALLPAHVIESGPFGVTWLRPQALFGAAGMDPVVHAVFWSLLVNVSVFAGVSILTLPAPMERLQGAQFVDAFRHPARAGRSWSGGQGRSEDLLLMTQRIIGAQDAHALFSQAAREQGSSGYLPEPTPEFLQRLERLLSGSVGAATAQAMVSQIAGDAVVSIEEMMAVADEAAQTVVDSRRLQEKTEEQERTASQLREANRKLMRLSEQKDTFLSQVSHELRTPMTSIRAFSEILRDADALTAEERNRHASIILEEAMRLTRLLDGLLDLSVLDSGKIDLNVRRGALSEQLDRAIEVCDGIDRIRILRDPADEAVEIETDLDRLRQVFINLISNACKYCEAPRPELRIEVRSRGGRIEVDFVDNGMGIPEDIRAVMFEKFSRGGERAAVGTGLGLAICREIMSRIGGEVLHLPDAQGTGFRVILSPAGRAGGADATL